MGYTHYWTPTGTFANAGFAELRITLKQIIDVAALSPWSIGIKLEREDLGNIWLNGAPLGEEDEDELVHETFCLNPTDTNFQFCKTARKPYDTVVIACLLAAETIAQDNGFSMGLGSDGDNDDWRDGCALYEAVCPDRLRNYHISVDDFALEPAEVISLEAGYVVPQNVPTASLGDDAPDPVAEEFSSSLRIWWDNPEAEDFPFYWEVSSATEAEPMLQLLSAYDLSLFANSGSGGLQRIDPDGNWEDITDTIAPF